MTEVTLQIPDNIYEAAMATAKREERSVEEVLVEQHFTEYESRFYVDPRHDQMAREIEAYEAMHDELKTHHLGDYVAIHGGQLVDWDADTVELYRRIRVTHPDQVVLHREVEAQPTRVIKLGFVRLKRKPTNALFRE